MLEEQFKKDQDPLLCDFLIQTVILNVNILFTALNVSPQDYQAYSPLYKDLL